MIFFLTGDLFGYNIRKDIIQGKILKTDKTVDSDSSFITSDDSWSSTDMDYTIEDENGKNN